MSSRDAAQDREGFSEQAPDTVSGGSSPERPAAWSDALDEEDIEIKQIDASEKTASPYPTGSVGAWMWGGLERFLEKHGY